jgi:hypothetical protein
MRVKLAELMDQEGGVNADGDDAAKDADLSSAHMLEVADMLDDLHDQGRSQDRMIRAPEMSPEPGVETMSGAEKLGDHDFPLPCNARAVR